ncbi:hypothetical protein [Bradyrhizobium sp. USDA 4341]
MAIEYQDPVVGFVIGKSYGYRASGVTGFTGATPYWQALSLPFRGRYDDYGFAEKIDHAHAPISLKAATGAEFAVIENAAKKGEDIEVDLGWPYGKSKLMTMFVHADVFEALTAKTPGLWGPAETLYANEAARFDEFLVDATRLAGGGTGKPRGEGESFSDLSEFVELWTSSTGRNWTETPEVARFFIRNRCNGVHSKLQQAMTGIVGRLHAEGRHHEARAVLADCLRTVFFDQNLELLRRQWQPQGGLGSDDRAYELHAEMAALTSRRCEVRSADEYEGPEDDEEDAAQPAP